MAPETQPELDPVPEPEQEKKPRAFIPKQDHKAEVLREHVTVDVAEPNAVAPTEQVRPTTQLTVDAAIAEAMTKGKPMSFIRQLAAEHRLIDVTSTYKAMEELGHK